MRMSTNLFAFAAGAIVGSAVAWFYAKKYYEKIADDEIDSMKEWVARRVEEQDKVAGRTPDPEEANHASPSAKPDLMEYASRVEGLGYTNYADTQKRESAPAPKEVNVVDEPYVIKPEIFGEEDDYDEVSLTYYTGDGVLTDEQDVPVEDVAGTVGEDFAEHFGDYEDDSVFVRNDHLKTDFEILADQRRYSDVVKNKSHPVEDE